MAIAAADLNKDGNLDLLTANCLAGAVSVLLGSTNEIFGSGTNFAVGNYPYDVAVADFNQDSNLDVAVPNAAGTWVNTPFGNGAGGFPNSSNYTVGSDPRCVAVADMNLDGAPDLVYGLLLGCDVGVLTNDGAGGFAVSTNSFTRQSSFRLAAGDFNGDGKPDIAATMGTPSGDLNILFGNGTGSFTSFTTYHIPLSSARSVAVGDLNGDDVADLVVGCSAPPGGVTYLGNGDGTFVKSAGTELPGDCYDARIADLNEDGKPDITAVLNRVNEVRVLINTSKPELRIRVVSDAVRLSWPNWEGYLLESNEDLAAVAGWFAVTNVPVVVGNQKIVTNSVGTGSLFYRLRKP